MTDSCRAALVESLTETATSAPITTTPPSSSGVSRKVRVSFGLEFVVSAVVVGVLVMTVVRVLNLETRVDDLERELMTYTETMYAPTPPVAFSSSLPAHALSSSPTRCSEEGKSVDEPVVMLEDNGRGVLTEEERSAPDERATTTSLSLAKKQVTFDESTPVVEEDPPAQEDLARDPPVRDPPAQDLPVRDPPARDPPARDPPVRDPPVRDPPAATTRPRRKRKEEDESLAVTSYEQEAPPTAP